MATPILCDVHGQAHLADVLVTQLENGDTLGACSAGYAELARALVEAIDAPEREATDTEAVRRLGGDGDPEPGRTSPDSSGADDPDGGSPGEPASGDDPTANTTGDDPPGGDGKA